MQNITVYDLLNLGMEGCDVSDDEIDVLWVYVSIGTDKDDPMDNCVNWILKHVNVENIQKGHVVGKFSQFIRENMSALKKFCAEVHNERYQLDYEDEDDNVEIALETLESLFIGNYSDNDYKLLYKLLTNN